MKKILISISILMLLLLPLFSVSGFSNEEPSVPTINGECEAKLDEMCTYTVVSTDPDRDNIVYELKYSDDPGAVIEIGPYKSGKPVTFTHCWCDFYQKTNPGIIHAKAKDIFDHESEWSTFEVNITDLDTESNDIAIRENGLFAFLTKCIDWLIPLFNFIDLIIK